MGKAFSRQILKPDVLGRIVRRGHHDAAVEPEAAHGEVEHRGRAEADVDHLAARALGDGARDGRGGEADVASDGDAARLQEADHGAAEPLGEGLVDLGRILAADVVGFEDGHREDERYTTAGG
jgi:hypothetical protein